jgi:tape measure domain-containing protein
MADETGASFVLKLVDKITAPARAMTTAVRGLAEAERQVQAASTVTTRAILAVGTAAAVASTQVHKLASAQAVLVSRTIAVNSATGRGVGGFLSKMGAMQGPVHMPHLAGAGSRGSHGFSGPIHDRFMSGAPQGFIGPRRATGMERFTSQLTGAGKEMWRWNEAVGESNTQLSDMFHKLASTPLGLAARGLKAIAGAAFDMSAALLEAALSVSKLLLGLGAIAAGAFVYKILELSNFAERAKFSLSSLAGSTEDGAREFNQARRIALELGQGVEQVTQQFIKLRAAQFSPADSESILKLSADLATLGEGAEAAESVVRAITQIKAKGRLQAEEMMQLAEGGNLSQNRIYEQLEQMTGMNREQLLKAQQKGAITAAMGITAIQRAILHKFHEAKPGDVAKDVANKTLGGVWARLKAMPDIFMLDIAESVNTTKLKEGMQVIIQAFQAGGKSKLTAFAQKSIDLMGELVPLVVDFAEGFMAGFDGILEGLDLLEPAKLKEAARGAGEWLANFFGNAIKFAEKAIPIISNAVSEFLKSVDWDALTESLLKVDWGKLAKDLLLIAEALLKISMLGVTTAAGVVSSVQYQGRGMPQIQKEGGNLWESIKSNMLLYGGLGAGGGALVGSAAPGVGTVLGGAVGGIGGGALGLGFGLWDWLLDEGIQATAPTAGADGPQASMRAVVTGNTFSPTITIQAPVGADEAKLARLVGAEVEKSLYGFASNELSEAVPA